VNAGQQMSALILAGAALPPEFFGPENVGRILAQARLESKARS